MRCRPTPRDADDHRLRWAQRPGVPANLTVLPADKEDTIVAQIDAAQEKASFVIIDLEGVASLMVSYAISLVDFVVIPVQGSPLDAEQAARQVRLIRGQERIAGRAIPFAVLFTRANPAIQPRAQRFIEERFAEANVPMFAAKLYEREAFRYIFAYRGTIAGLKDRALGNVPAAVANAHANAARLHDLSRIHNSVRIERMLDRAHGFDGCAAMLGFKEPLFALAIPCSPVQVPSMASERSATRSMTRWREPLLRHCPS